MQIRRWFTWSGSTWTRTIGVSSEAGLLEKAGVGLALEKESYKLTNLGSSYRAQSGGQVGPRATCMASTAHWGRARRLWCCWLRVGVSACQLWPGAVDMGPQAS